MTTIRKKLALLLSETKKKQYTPLKWMQSSGTQYIDTGVKADQTTRAEIAFCFPEVSSSATSGRVFGSRESAVLNAFGIGTYSGQVTEGDKLTVYFSNGSTGSLAQTTITAGQWYITYISKDLITNNGTIETGSSTANFETPSTLKLFGFDNAGTIGCGIVRIASCRIIKNNVLVRDFVPALDENKTPCMWDRVTNKLFYNQGTGTFTYEEWKYTACDYIESATAGADAAYIDTLFKESAATTKLQLKAKSKFYGVFDVIGNADPESYPNGTKMLGYNSTNQVFLYYKPTGQRILTTLDAVASNTLELDEVFDKTNSTMSISNGYETKTGTYSGLYSTSSYMLFWRGNTSINPQRGTLCYTRFYENNILRRDFIPAIDEENRAGMYDACLNMMFYSSSTTDFVGHFVDESNNDYTVVKYISTANQQTNSGTNSDCAFLMTGLNSKPTTKSLTRMRFTTVIISSSGYEALSGTNISSRFVWGFANVSPRTGFYMGLGSQNINTTVNRDSNWHIFSLDWNDASWQIDSTKGYFDSAGPARNSGTLALFGRNNANSTTSINKAMDGDCSWHKMFESGVLVQNLIACLKGTEAGMYDTVTKTFIGSSGRRDFTYTA